MATESEEREVENGAPMTAENEEKPTADINVEPEQKDPNVDANTSEPKDDSKDAKAKAAEEAKLKAAEEAKATDESEAELKAEEEAKLKAEAEAKAAEEAKLKAEAEAKAQAEAEAKAAEEAKLKAEAEAKAQAEEEAKLKAEEEAKAAEEAKLKAEAEAKAQAEEEAKLKAEEEAKAAEEAKLKAEAEAKAQAEEEAKLEAEAEAKAAEEATKEELEEVPIAQAKVQVVAQPTSAPVESEAGKPRPIVFAGPSGAGKGTLIASLMKRYPDDQFGFCVSHTTRAPREGEINGLHYHFTTVDDMKKAIADGKFIEYAEVHGNYYGTSVEAVKSVQSKGQVCILDIDVQGVKNVKKSTLNAYYVFIAPPSMEDLEARLRGRGTEKEEDIKKRLANAKGEIDYGKEPGNFNKYLINGDLSKASADLNATITAWYPHLSAATVEGGNAFVKQCASNCVIS